MLKAIIALAVTLSAFRATAQDDSIAAVRAFVQGGHFGRDLWHAVRGDPSPILTYCDRMIEIADDSKTLSRSLQTMMDIGTRHPALVFERRRLLTAARLAKLHGDVYVTTAVASFFQTSIKAGFRSAAQEAIPDLLAAVQEGRDKSLGLVLAHIAIQDKHVLDAIRAAARSYAPGSRRLLLAAAGDDEILKEVLRVISYASTSAGDLDRYTELGLALGDLSLSMRIEALPAIMEIVATDVAPPPSDGDIIRSPPNRGAAHSAADILEAYPELLPADTVPRLPAELLEWWARHGQGVLQRYDEFLNAGPVRDDVSSEGVAISEEEYADAAAEGDRVSDDPSSNEQGSRGWLFSAWLLGYVAVAAALAAGGIYLLRKRGRH